MTITATPGAAATYASLRTKVRRAAGDADAERWSDTRIDEVLDYQMAEMWRAMGQDPSAVVSTADLTYTANAAEVALTDVVAAGQIYKVEDISTATRPRILEPVGLVRIENTEDEERIGTSQRVWALRERNLVVRPRSSSDLSLRIWYIGAPYVVTGTAGDQHPFPVQHEEYLVMGAANRLREPDDELPLVAIQRYERLREEFMIDASRIRAPRRARIRSRRHRFF